nr:hypothetical protein [Tanacetum cinerariifolium]
MHNNIMAAGSRDRQPMLAPGRYAQWRSRFMRYIDTKDNCKALKKCLEEGPYVPSTVIILAKLAIETSDAVEEHSKIETLASMSDANKAHFKAEKEAIHMILTGIRDEIYLTVDACNTAHEMRIAIERFYKMINEMVRNNLHVDTMQVNVQFLQQLQPKWSRFITIVKKKEELDKVSYHKLFDIMKQYQNESNELCAEKIARNANPLALVVAAQQYPDSYYQAPKPQRSFTPTLKQSSSTRSHATKRVKGKEIAKPITPPSESASKEDSDLEQAQRDKDMETVGSQVAQQTGIQCFDCKEFGHFAKEFRKPKRVKDYMYYKEKMLLCKQAKEAHYSFMAKIQEVLPIDLGTDAEPLEKECDDERVVLTNLIANLTLDTKENKKILKQLKKANTSLYQELKECKYTLEETTRALGESNTNRDSCLIALQNQKVELEKYKTYLNHPIENDKLELERLVKEKNQKIKDLKLKEENDIDKMITMEKQLKFLNDIVYTRNQSIQTIHMLAPKGSTYNGRPTFANPLYLKKVQSKKSCLHEIPYDTSDPANRFTPNKE